MRPLLALLALVACEESPAASPEDAFDWDLPEGVAPPPVPADNPQTAEKVTLGRFLFYDTRLAINQKRSCGICHEDRFGFTDSFVRAVGATNEIHPRNTLSLTNVGYRAALTWVDPDLGSLEAQALIPLLGDDPIVELGYGGQEQSLIDLLRADPLYALDFAAAFPDDPEPVTIENVAKAIAAFERTLISRDSPFDRFNRGDPDAISPSARRGAALFFSPATGCSRCHGGLDLMATTDAQGEIVAEHGYYNVGLYNVDGLGGYPEGRTGLHATTGDPADMGAFRAPTLRNVEVSGPYLSDGTGATLEDVIDIFDAGGRVLVDGPNPGDGRANPFKSPLVRPLNLSPDQKADLVAFLKSLTDEGFLENPRLSNPFRNNNNNLSQDP